MCSRTTKSVDEALEQLELSCTGDGCEMAQLSHSSPACFTQEKWKHTSTRELVHQSAEIGQKMGSNPNARQQLNG